MAEYAKRPVSETIASGFSANRRTGGYKFKAACNELARIAVGHRGVDLYFATYDAAHPRRAEVRVVKTHTVREKSAQFARVGRLNRVEVYGTIERTIPSLKGWYDVQAGRLQPKEDGITRQGDSTIAVELDAKSVARLGGENYDIGSKLAELAEVPMDELEWPRHSPDLVLAHVSRDTPDEVTARMRTAVQEHISRGFDFRLAPVRLLPRLPTGQQA